MTEIEVRESAGADAEGPPESPYKNLLVPLVVVPALIVMVLVLVFVLFGAIAGEEATPEENIERLLHGGANDRDQAAFDLMRQVLVATSQGSEAEAREDWELDPSLTAALKNAWEARVESALEDEDDVPIALALTIVLARMGDPEGVGGLIDMVGLDPGLDPDGVYRFYAGMTLGNLGQRLSRGEKERGARALIELLESEDPGLRGAAVIGLQTLPGPETIPALKPLLAERSVELRLNAALSLARLGDPAGVPILFEMVGEEPYLDERAADPTKWARQTTVSESRQKALEALAGLGQAPERAELERLAEDDPDAGVRETALRLLAGPVGG